MARKVLRKRFEKQIEQLGESRALNGLLEQAKRYQPGIVDFIRQTGELPPALKAQDPDLFANLETAFEMFDIRSPEDAKSVIDSLPTAKEPSASDIELEEKQRALELQGVSKPVGIDKSAIVGAILNANQGTPARYENGVETERSTPTKVAQADRIANSLIAGESLESVVKKEYGNRGTATVDSIVKEFKIQVEPVVKGEKSKFLITPEEIKQAQEAIPRVQDILGARASTAQKEAAITDFLTQQRTQLPQERERFLRGETERARQAFAENVPRVQEQLAARGRLFGGGQAELLSEAALDITGTLQNIELQLTAEDNDLFFNAAYENALRKAIESRTDFRQALQEEQANVITQRGRTFQSQQAALDRALQEALNIGQFERQAKVQRQRLESEKKERERKSSSGLFSGIGGAVGAIAGAATGSPVGAVIGQQAGATLGSVG